MPKQKVTQEIKLLRVEMTPNDVGTAAQVLYNMVDPKEPGYDLFDKYQLARLREEFFPRNQNRFTLTVEQFFNEPYWRVFAELK